MIALLAMLLMAGSGVLLLGRYLSRRGMRLTYRCIRSIAEYVVAPSAERLPHIRSGLSLVAFAEAVAFVAERLCNEADEQMREIVRYYALDSRLLLMAERANSTRRAYLLALLARMPLDASLLRRIEKMMDDTDEDVRLYALMCCFAIDERVAVRHLCRFGRRLSRFEACELLPKVCRYADAVAWTPLLRSEDYNLALLGICIVRRYSIIESEADLHNIIGGTHRSLQYDALCALAELQCDLSTTHIRHWIQQQETAVRHAVCRHLVRTGYSLRSAKRILGREERVLFEQMLNTYKRHIG